MGTERRTARRPDTRLITGGLVVVSLLVAAATLPLGSQALTQARRDAVARAVDFVDRSIAPQLDGSRAAPISRDGSVQLERVAGRIRTRGDVTRFRLWSLAGDLIYTSDGAGGRQPAPAQAIAASEGSIRDVLSGGGDSNLQTFIPAPAGRDHLAVVQVDQPYLPISAAVADRWSAIRLGAGVASSFFLALLLLTAARRRRGRSPADGGFSHDRSSAAHMHGAGPERSTDKRLERSEQAREALEDQLGQLRTQVAETEARAAERARVFGAQVTEAEARVKELEGLLRQAEERAARTAREAPFADAVEEQKVVDARIDALQEQLGSTSRELAEARARVAELEPLVAQSAARVEQAESEASRGALAADARVQRTEARTEELERQLTASAARVAEMERFVRDSEQRLAASADVAERSSLRIRELEGQLEALRHDTRTDELEEELAAAHRAGKEAMRLAMEAQADTQRTRDELARTRAELAVVQTARPAEPERGATRNGHGADTEAPAEMAPEVVEGTVDEDPAGTSDEDPSAEAVPEDEGEGPSLRYRLAHSAAQRKGRGGTRPEEAWSSPARGG